MGRQKKAPIRRPEEASITVGSDGDEESAGNSEVLGRYVHNRSLQDPQRQSLNMMLAAELAEDTEHRIDHNNSLEDSEEEDTKLPSDSRHPLEDSDDDEDDDDDDEMIVNRNMPPILAEIERKIAAREREALMRRQQNKKRKTSMIERKKPEQKNRRRVQFVGEESPETQLSPEIVLELAAMTQNTVLRITSRLSSESNADPKEEAGAILATLDLPRTIVQLPTNTTASRLQSEASIRSLWNHYYLPTESCDEEHDFICDLIKCQGAGWLHVTVCSSASPALTISITKQAFEACRQMPLVQKISQWSKFGMHNTFQRVIRGLFSISNAAPFFPSHLRSLEEITARHVYNLVDNQQLERYANGQKSFPTMDIPGLVPTLRPYQAAAVQWMLQRESLSQPGEEWKVAWTVLDPSTRDVISLYQLDEKEVLRVRNEILLYCPFNGWIAGSLEEARNMTLNGRTIPIRGGCLSESMGLGKTVELLACILAHPMPNPTTERNTKASCQRRLVFEEQCLRGGNDDRNGDDTVGVVVDAANFADDEASGDEDDTEGMHHEPSQHGFSEEAPARTNVVTPDKNRFPVEVRWIDDMEVGSCICGEIISFPSGPRKQKNVIVFCKGCDEPMHLQCTCLESHDVAVSKKLILRRTSGNKQLECVLCEDCPCCIVANQKGTIKSRATVIVCPPAILDQWDREVKRHTRVRGGSSLKVAVYEGVESISKNQKKHASALRLLHPRFLANSDIILIPFGALMSDLGHSDDNRYIRQGDGDRWTSCSLRKRKKYRIVPSPLLSIHFWRVAIDEAQRVEVTTTKAAKMALKLNADHLWAVSGTPVGHGKLEDLYGLLLFLGLSPFDCKDWFKSCLSPAVDGVDERIKALLKDCFWRSTKASPVVKEQLGIPEMKENRIVLKFSSIEKHFYSTQLSATMRLAGDISSRTDFGSKWQLESLTESLQRLRAACCHPQVGSHGVTGGRLQKVRQLDGNSVATRVLSMEQILDKFIDDAKQKCEEAQRIAIMHTNAMAAITRLKVDAKTRGIRVEEDDRSLLMKSGDLYKESLALAETNSFPQNACGEAILTGNIGFCNPNHVMNDGNCEFSWKIQKEDCDELWAKVEYQGPPKKIKKVQFKAHLSLPEKLALENSNDFTWQVSCPARIVLQVAMASDGGEFVDVAEAPVRSDGSWSVLEKFGPTNRSRAWRILLKMKHDDGHKLSSGSGIGLFVGLDVELYEAHIDSDSLQLLHSLHNASLVYESALQVREGKNHMADEAMMQHQIASMREEAGQIELLYKRQPQILHKTCMEKFKELMRKRKAKEEELFCITTSGKASESLIDGWDDGWYHDFLSAVSLYGSESLQTAVLERIIQDIEGIYIEDNSMRFPDFSNLTGLRAALGVRLSKIRSEGLGKKQATLPATTAENEFVQIRSARYKCGAGEHARCMEAIELLSPDPDVAELVENSHCRLCKADWNQTGPICKHCKIAEVLQDLRPDTATVAVFSALYSAVRIPVVVSLLEERGLSNIIDRAKTFFELLDAEEREKVGAWKMWGTHLKLLNDYDELASTKQSMRLSLEGENLTLYTEDQLNAIIQPIDLMANYHDHAAKQAMSLGDLRRATGTLRYLQNQRSESGDSDPENCIVCLQSLRGECCVLRCGHRFHEKPCFDQILRGNPGTRVHCPLKCRESTAKNEVMVATDKSRNDGSRANRAVKGSFGTKVTRIVADILTMRDKGEKGVVFSQWNTMLEIVEAALWENGVTTARPQGGKKFKEGIRQFQSPECSVLLLHLKQGAEGLTLVQATNVFMIEPVMNSGLDQQAINRIHRIGQTKTCHVWRYLIEDTIEMKLDQIRLRHQLEDADVIEETVMASRRTDCYFAGGCDGGFASTEELMELLG